MERGHDSSPRQLWSRANLAPQCPPSLPHPHPDSYQPSPSPATQLCSALLSFLIPRCQLSHSAVTIRPRAAGYKITPRRPPQAGVGVEGPEGSACKGAPAASCKQLN